MKRIIIHIGYPKTGSTWFQTLFYPMVKDYVFFDRKEFYRLLVKSNDDFLQYVKNKYRECNLIICEEHLILQRDIETRIKANRLKEAFNFENVKIVVFIRNQKEILASSYSEVVKSQRNISLNDYIYSLFETKEILQWDYYSQIKIFETVFGKSNVKVFLYEDFKANNKEFIRNYIVELNLKINMDEINFRLVNKSLHPYLIPFVIFFNKVQKTLNVNLNSFSKKIYMRVNNRLSEKRIRISESDKNKIHDVFSSSNAKIAKEYNLNLNKYNYPL